MGTIFLVNNWRASETLSGLDSRFISESAVATLYVRLSGIVRKLIQKSTGMDTPLLSFFFLLAMSRAGDNTKDAMKKHIRRIHSFFSHVRPRP